VERRRMAVAAEVPQKIVLSRVTSIRLKDRFTKQKRNHPLQRRYPEVFKELESAEEKPKNLRSFK